MKRNIIYKWSLLTALFPFTSVYTAIKGYKVNVFPFVFTLFFFFLGTQIIPTDSNDIGRYLMRFSAVANDTSIPFWTYFYSLEEDNQIDLAFPFITWLVSRVTTNPQVYAGVLSMMMGLFFSLNMSYIVKRLGFSSSLVTLLVFTLFFIPNPSFYTHRWWIAMQVFLFGALPYCLDGKNKTILFSAASVLVHFSFLYPVLLLLLNRVVPKRLLFLFLVLFVSSNLVEELNLSAIATSFEQFLPDSFVSRNDMYLNLEMQDHNWFSQSYRFVWKYINFFLAIYIYIRFRKSFEYREGIMRLFLMALIIGSFATIANLTEWGWRYLDISNFLFCSVYILLLGDSNAFDQKFLRVLRFASPFFLYVILFQIRGIFSVIGVKAFLLGNIFTTWFINDAVSVLDVLKG